PYISAFGGDGGDPISSLAPGWEHSQPFADRVEGGVGILDPVHLVGGDGDGEIEFRQKLKELHLQRDLPPLLPAVGDLEEAGGVDHLDREEDIVASILKVADYEVLRPFLDPPL